MTKTADASVGKPGAVGVEKFPDDGALSSAEEFHQWWSERHRNRWLEVTRVPFAEVDSWSFEEDR